MNPREDAHSKVPHTCLLKIQSVYDVLKSAERKAVEYIMTHPDEIPGISIVDLATRAGCSEATIVRLSKRLGYEGFPELKIDFARSSELPVFEYESISRDDEPHIVFRKVVESTVSALHDTVGIMDYEHYTAAVDAIVNAETVMFCGLGDAMHVALEAHQRFARAGKRSVAAVDPDFQLILARQLKPGDVIVAISHTGRSRTVVDTVKSAKEVGATVIAITNYPVSPLAKRADIPLLTAVFTQYLTVEVMSKRVTELCIIESLYVNYLIKKGKPAIERLKESDRVVRINKV